MEALVTTMTNYFQPCFSFSYTNVRVELIKMYNERHNCRICQEISKILYKSYFMIYKRLRSRSRSGKVIYSLMYLSQIVKQNEKNAILLSKSS